MVQAYNKQSKQWEEIAPEHAIQAYQSGQYGFNSEQEIPVVSPSGIHGTIKARDMDQALFEGFSQIALPQIPLLLIENAALYAKPDQLQRCS